MNFHEILITFEMHILYFLLLGYIIYLEKKVKKLENIVKHIEEFLKSH